MNPRSDQVGKWMVTVYLTADFRSGACESSRCNALNFSDHCSGGD
jgi:hypothetical protein